MHSPVYMDQGAYDAIDSASDWDYYTDEYFDDDLSVMRKQSLEVTTSPNGAAGKKMRNKRKQGEQQHDDNDNINNEDDPNSFCRILWRSSGYLVDQGELYEPGKGEKVALLKNWREIFKDSQPKRDHRLQKSVSSSRLPQSSFSKSAAGRKQPGRPKKTEKRNAGVKIGRIVDVPVFESDGSSGEGSESEGGGEGGGGGDGEYLTPPPSFLSASQQEIYEKSRKTAGPSRSSNNGKDHDRRTGSHLKSVMSASAQEEIPEPAPIMPSSPSSSTTNSKRRSGRLSAHPATTTTTTTTTQSATSILQNEGPGEPSTSLQDGNGADIADNIPSAGKGNSPPTHRQGRKRKASNPLDNTDGDDRGGKKRSKRATTRRKLDDDDHDDKNTGKSKNKTKDFPPATITTTIRRSLRERKK